MTRQYYHWENQQNQNRKFIILSTKFTFLIKTGMKLNLISVAIECLTLPRCIQLHKYVTRQLSKHKQQIFEFENISLHSKRNLLLEGESSSYMLSFEPPRYEIVIREATI